MMGRVPEAQAAYKQALKLDPNLEPAKQDLALLSGGKPDPAVLAKHVEVARTQVHRDPRDVAARERLAQALLVNNQVKEAEAETKALLDMAPAHVGGNILMARLRFAQGRPDDAVTHLRAALRTNPNDLEANVTLARYLSRQNRREEARPLFETALRVNPNLADVKYDLGILYAQSGRLPDAMRLAEELAKALPKDPLPLTLKGQILLAQGNVKAAADAFSAAIALGGDVAGRPPRPRQGRPTRGSTDRAIESYRKALTRQRERVLIPSTISPGSSSSTRSEPDEALPFAIQAQQLAPQSAQRRSTRWAGSTTAAAPTLEAEKLLTRGRSSGPQQRGDAVPPGHDVRQARPEGATPSPAFAAPHSSTPSSPRPNASPT